MKENIRTELRIKKQQIEGIIAYKTQGAILRSKVKGYNEGEKNTKYFHSLEKRRFNSKTKSNPPKRKWEEVFDGRGRRDSRRRKTMSIFTGLQGLMSMIMIIFFP